LALVALALVPTALACKEQQGPALPPAQGEGAPPPPKLPTLQQIGEASPQPRAASTDRAGVGSLRPLQEASLGPKETGIITSISVDEGDAVKKGKLLFQLDSAQFEFAVAQAKAAQAAAQVQFDAARLDHERTAALRARNSIAQDLADQAKARLDAATSALEQARAAYGLAQRRAANMAVYSPIDGIVTARRMNVGETATLMPPSIVLVIQNLDVLELRARLPESALRSVREQSELVVTFPALDERRKVKVKRIAPVIDARTRTIEIVAELPNADHRLKAGMLAEVSYTPAPAPNGEKPTPGTDANAPEGAQAHEAR
jgi:RND family efflux transporter MFP subunit